MNSKRKELRMIAYQRLNFDEREELSRYLVLDYSYRQIALCLNRSVSTISRELQRNQAHRWGYRAVTAQRRAGRIMRQSRRKLKLETNELLRTFVLEHLELRWSPQQIARRLRILYPDDMSMRVSHETIYAYLYVHPRGLLKRRLVKQLRRKHKKRRIRDKARRKSYPIQDYISIDERPAEVKNRKVAGHWEGDLVMGVLNKSAIGTLVERTSRLTLLVKLPKKDASSVCAAFTRKFNRLPNQFKRSLTYDQGQEMADHKVFTEQTKVKVYFAHPHAPWERGTSENTNMLIRDFYPKGTDFSKITAGQLQKVQDMLNDRPRKVLNFYTPREVFTKTVALETGI
jgi:IS30 family transposase